MKKLVFLFLAAGLMLMSGCSKDESTEPDNGGNTNNTSGTMTLNSDGASWSAGLAVVATNSGGIITVTGSDNSAHQCQIAVSNVTGPGTFTLGASMTNPNYGRWTTGLGQNDTYTTMLGQGEGEVVITSLSAASVAGTFHFSAKNGAGTMVTISSGEFNASF
ncbi:MAG: hypothetical protein Kow00127_20270 [Bacteroidales bacterium]